MQHPRLASILVACLVGGCASSGIEGRLVDLTHPFDEQTVFWPTEQEGFVLETVFAGEAEGGWWYAANRFRTAEHGGTHLDAPLHFARGGAAADAIPLERLIAPGLLIDAAGDGDPNPDPDRQVDWDGSIPRGAIVLVRTGHGRHWGDRTRYLGTGRSGPEAVPELHFPGLSPALAERLVAAGAAAVGIDTASIDPGQSKDFQAHRILAAAGIPVFENVAQLEELPAGDFTVIALPMKIRGGSGAPLRIVAVVP
jgi:kynurenine formamidase